MTKKLKSHDSTFKFVFSDLVNVIDLLRVQFPPEIFNRLDVSTLQQVAESFLDKRLKAHFADLIYSCKFRTDEGEEDILISILLEHKSKADPYSPVQLLKYIALAYDKMVKNKQPLCPILPIIVYHGKDEWKVRSLKDCFHHYPEILRSYLPDFQFELLNLQEKTDAEIASLFEAFTMKCFMYLMKNIFNPKQLVNGFKKFAELLNLQSEIMKERGMPEHYLELFFMYICENTHLPEQKIIEIVQKFETPEKEMNTYQKIVTRSFAEGEMKGRQEGRQEGKQEGMKIHSIETAQQLLLIGKLTIEEISQCTGLSVADVQELKKKMKL